MAIFFLPLKAAVRLTDKRSPRAAERRLQPEYLHMSNVGILIFFSFRFKITRLKIFPCAGCAINLRTECQLLNLPSFFKHSPITKKSSYSYLVNCVTIFTIIFFYFINVCRPITYLKILTIRNRSANPVHAWFTYIYII